jgi:hypothetical protein
MKNIVSLMLFAALALSLGSVAYGQEIVVQAHVPFGFVLGDQTYPPGQYTVGTVSKNDSSLFVKNSDGAAKPALLRANPTTASEASSKTKLVFQRIGDTYFLYQVWLQGSSDGREFPTSKARMQLARNGAGSVTVVVSANIAH